MVGGRQQSVTPDDSNGLSYSRRYPTTILRVDVYHARCDARGQRRTQRRRRHRKIKVEKHFSSKQRRNSERTCTGGSDQGTDNSLASCNRWLRRDFSRKYDRIWAVIQRRHMSVRNLCVGNLSTSQLPFSTTAEHGHSCSGDRPPSNTTDAAASGLKSSENK